MAFISGTLGLGTGFDGSVLLEPSGSDYARQPITFDEVIGGLAGNASTCTFGPITSAWGTLTAFMVFDSSGNSVFPGTLAAPITTTIGLVLTVPVNDITLNFSAPALAIGTGSGSTFFGSSALNFLTNTLPSSPVGLTPGNWWMNFGLPQVILSTLPTSPAGLFTGSYYLNNGVVAQV